MASTPRFFVPFDDADLDVPRVILPKAAARHAERSLRLAAGEAVELFNGSGRVWRGTIGFSPSEAWVDVSSSERRPLASPLRTTLLQAWVAPEKTEWIVEKATELGVDEVVFFPAARSVTRLSGERLQKRIDRLRVIAQSACEQCGRNVQPVVRPATSLESALRSTESDVRLLLAPNALLAKGETLGSNRLPRSAAVAVGPEGGFTPQDEETAQ